MVKALVMFGLVAVLSLALLWKNIPIDTTGVATLAPTSTTPSTGPETMGVSTEIPAYASMWASYTDDQLGIRLRHPKDITLKKVNNQSLLLTGAGIEISISKEKMGSTDTINTLAEKDINRKKDSLDNAFKLVDGISPVAIGSQTGITYTTEESSKEVTYFYVSINSEYLKITDNTDSDKVSVSDNVIYSLELL